MFHRPVVRALGFPRYTVPALFVNGERVQGTREIVRAADRLWPEPPLLPRDPDARRAVEEVERWGEAELQPVVRRLQPWALTQRPEAVATLLDSYALPLPARVQGGLARPALAIGAGRNRSNEQTVRAALARLPAMLDHVDAWIADRVIGGDVPNAGDIQVASTLRVLLNYEDLEPAIAPRPGGKLARALLPELPGRVPPVFPADALAGLR